MPTKIRCLAYLALALTSLALPACRKAQPAVVQPSQDSPAEASPTVRSLILRSVGEGATSPQWFGDWYLLYTENGYLKAAIARPTSSGGTRVTVVTLERVEF